ncbi:Mov34/MPN/PAD-1 family protein [Methylobacterium radiotolerans]|uniref:Mov34/MPN/PAD-1 family protein n=1 Tax=Methylobacterium radiotolerans TaxID=31998 RepID=UPI001F3AB40B|nr:Mov34/MPN/PAD-1 family protein [Methylobacterium radiotolerans]UIY45313.1 Mov34/MPN/PAD-1 family protein [Methylobacterium radiotolerans]
MILKVDDRRLILLAPPVEAAIAAFVTDIEIGLEAGGIFIGSHRGQHLEITTCTTPLPRDVRRLALFDRKDPGHQAAALAAWQASGGTDTYVGEWHTHPVDDPTPSALDLRTWRSILARNIDPAVFMIVGRRSIWCAWGHRGELRGAEVLDAA